MMTKETSVQQQVANVVAQETDLLRKSRSLRLQIADAKGLLAKLEAEEAVIDVALVKIQHFLDGVGLGQRYGAEQAQDQLREQIVGQHEAELTA
jgi:hypothetical protein